MNGCIAEFSKLSEALANGKESLQGDLEEKAELRHFKDESLLVQPNRDVRKCPQGLGCGNPDSKSTGLTLRETFLQLCWAMDE